MATSCKIGVFDSGVGGLSVLQALQRQLPTADLLYIADSGFAPYGDKRPDHVLDRSRYLASFLLQQDIDALVIACNTATAAAASALRAEMSLPVIAMEPGLKPAIRLSRNGTIAVLATHGTLASQQFANLRERYAEGIKVIDVACSGWVELVEKGQHDSDLADALVKDTLMPAVNGGADTLVLGCTHFAFLRKAILKAGPPHVALVETADAVARQTQRCLTARLSGLSGSGQVRFWTSGKLAKTTHVISALLGYPVKVDRLPGTIQADTSCKADST